MRFWSTATFQEPVPSSTVTTQQQITKAIHIRRRSDIALQKLLLCTDARQHGQRTAQFPLEPKLDVGVCAVADDAGAAAIELELALDGVHHGLAGLAKGEGFLAAEHLDEGR